MRINKTIVIKGLLLTSPLLSRSSLVALIAYRPFAIGGNAAAREYHIGTLIGQNPATLGYSGAWDKPGFVSTSAPPLKTTFFNILQQVVASHRVFRSILGALKKGCLRPESESR